MKGMGSVSGVLVEDTVSLADGSLTVPSQRFIGASSVSSDFEQYPSDGLLGLAFASISRSSSPNFFENLLASRGIPTGIFAVHSSRGKEDGSEVCFGCYDLTKTMGPIRWASLTSRVSFASYTLSWEAFLMGCIDHRLTG